MEVRRANFFTLLPDLLEEIAAADFVAFDTELSGIPSRLHRPFDAGKQTLAERYAEVKEAAQRYHILQVGLTCVKRDDKTGKFILRPRNYVISPLIAEELGLDRDFTYSNDAVHFLLKNGYSMGEPFGGDPGIPYLTRESVTLVQDRVRRKWDRNAIPDIKVKDDDTDTLEFMRSAREQIQQWKDTRQPHKEYFIIRGKKIDDDTPGRTTRYNPLTRFERRLLHQIVRSDFPELSTQGHVESIKVGWKNEETERVQKLLVDRRIKSAVFVQSGFRWIMDALAGYGLEYFDAKSCTATMTPPLSFEEQDTLGLRLENLRSLLKGKKTVLVGHNCFLDLVFLHQHFYDELPETLEAFKASCSEKFPLVIDTKYMATEGPDGERMRAKKLWEIEEMLSNDQKPLNEIPKGHFQEGEWTEDKYHQAGFDSYITAIVFLKLAAKHGAAASDTLGKEKIRQQQAAEASHETERLNEGPSAIPDRSKTDEGQNDTSEVVGSKAGKRNKKRKKPSNSAATEQPVTSPFSHENRFGSLDDESAEGVQAAAETPASSSEAAKPAEEPHDLEKDLKRLGITETQESAPAVGDDIPGWRSEFWGQQGNKLRVYGTIEEVCDLNIQKQDLNVQKQDLAVEDNDDEDEDEEGGDFLVSRKRGIGTGSKKGIDTGGARATRSSNERKASMWESLGSLFQGLGGSS